MDWLTLKVAEAGHLVFQEHGAIERFKEIALRKSVFGGTNSLISVIYQSMNAIPQNQLESYRDHFFLMITVFRTHQKKLAIIIAALVIVAFGWLYNTTDLDKVGADQVAKVYGKTVYRLDYEKELRKFGVAVDLGLTGLAQDLSYGAVSYNDAADRFVYNNIVAQSQAERLGVLAPDSEVVARIRTLPSFQNNGQFDPNRYALIISQALTPRGFSERDFEALIRDEIRVRRLREVVGSAGWASPAEVSLDYQEMFGKVEAALVRFPIAKQLEGVEVSDDEVLAFFEEQKAHLSTEEKRRAEWVVFQLPEEAKALEGRERVAALQKVSNAAADFSVAVIDRGADFATEAEKAAVTVQSSELFSKNAVPAELRNVPDGVGAIFQLSEAEPTTDPFQVENDFYVFRLVEVEAPRPLTIEEATPLIVERLRRDKAMAATKELAMESHGKMAKLLEDGKSWEEATAETLGEVTDLPAFSRMEPAMGLDDSAEIMENAFRLGAGKLSTPLEGRDSVYSIFVKNRDVVDAEGFEGQKASFTTRVEERKEREVFQEWLRLQRQAANIQILGQG